MEVEGSGALDFSIQPIFSYTTANGSFAGVANTFQNLRTVNALSLKVGGGGGGCRNTKHDAK